MPRDCAGRRLCQVHQCVPVRARRSETAMQVNVDIVQRVAREFPGFVSATVHRSLDPHPRDQLPPWQTATDLSAMQRSSGRRREPCVGPVVGSASGRGTIRRMTPR